jgi:Uma2 family endonuclease
LSPSTSSYDQGKKFSLYQSLKSLREYILIDSQELGARVFRKNDEGAWLISSIAYDINSSIEIGHIGLTLKMSTIYEQTIDLL